MRSYGIGSKINVSIIWLTRFRILFQPEQIKAGIKSESLF